MGTYLDEYKDLYNATGITGAFQVVLVVKKPSANIGDIRDAGSIPGLGRSLEGVMATHFLPGESHGQRSLVGYSS